MLEPSHIPRYGGQEEDDRTPRRSQLGTRKPLQSGDTFKVPSIPRQPFAPTSAINMDPSTSTGGSSRLKRLSLVAKPPSLAVGPSIIAEDGEDMGKEASPRAGAPGTPRRSVGMRSSISYSPALGGGMSGTRGSFDAPSRRSVERRTKNGSERIELDQGTRDRAEKGDRTNEERAKQKKGETLLERHADLLTLIAQKERRVNELKEELATQEASLIQLKSRWTSLISRPPSSSASSSSSSSSSNITRIRPSSMHQPRDRTSMSISSSTSSNLSSTSTQSQSHSFPSQLDLLTPLSPTSPTSLDQSIANILSSIPGPPDRLISGEAIEGGKRFWDQLVKTVSAAASGNVPDNTGSTPSTSALAVRNNARGDGDGISRGEGGGMKSAGEVEREYRSALDGVSATFDLSDLKGLLPSGLPTWSLTSPIHPSIPEGPTTDPPDGMLSPTGSTSSSSSSTASRSKGRGRAEPLRPANVTRLPSTGSVTSPSQSLLDADEDVEGAGLKVMTPNKSMRNTNGVQQTQLASPETEHGQDDGQSDDGWGW